MKHLRYKLNDAYDSGEKIHPQKVMMELGINYRGSIPQTLGDQWWFLNCKHVPRKLPPYLTELFLDKKEYKRWIA